MEKADLAKRYTELNKDISHDLSVSFDKKTPSHQKKALSKVSEQLDKYYTKKVVAEQCYKQMKDLIKSVADLSKAIFVEPSAGSGVFLDIIEETKIGADIAPTKESKHLILKHDFLNQDFSILIEGYSKEAVFFIGNPPFGKKGDLALAFLNKALSYGETVGFIVPIQFRKWSIQSKINPSAKLLLDLELPEVAFEFMGSDYALRCCFQVWSTSTSFSLMENFRLKNKPEISHPDFEMYQYNRTVVAEKYFDYDWDFAVPRQGYLDYNFKSFRKEDCNKKHQWIFFKAKNKQALERLLKLDFVALSKKNIGTPGFGKADVIMCYIGKQS